MIAKCLCSEQAYDSLIKHLGVSKDQASPLAEVEFRELPYFFVSRSKEQWMEGQGDVNAVRISQATDLGLLFDPGANSSQKERKVCFVPWLNIISLSFIDSDEAAKS